MKTAPQANALPWALAWRVALGQIVSWGILYYAFTVVVGPMQIETGWPRPLLNGGLSIGLLTWGVCAFPAGAWIQRRGGRGLMTLAALLGGLALVLMGLAHTPAVYLLAWSLLGAAMAGVLYEPAFAVVTEHFGPHYRRGITLVTLVGGLASTAFIPLAQLAVEHLGWRGALMSLGAVQIMICVPLHGLGIPDPIARRGATSVANHATTRVQLAGWWLELRRDITDRRFLGLAIWFTAHSAAFTGLIFQLIPILQAADVSTGTILQAIALIGPMQVLGRLALATRGERFATLSIGAWAMVGLAASVVILLFLPRSILWLACFAVLYGASNGVMTILRGTAVAEVFGRVRYAELNGALALPAVLAKAASPLVLAALWTASGTPRAVFVAILAFLIAGGAGLHLARVPRSTSPSTPARQQRDQLNATKTLAKSAR